MPSSNDYREIISYALRDIKAGEEILENYEDYLSLDAEWVIKLMEEFNPSRIEFEEEIRKSLEARQKA